MAPRNNLDSMGEVLVDLREVWENAVSQPSNPKVLDALNKIHPSALAKVLDGRPTDELVDIIPRLDRRFAGKILVELEEESCENLVKGLEDLALAEMFHGLASDESAYLLARADEDCRQRILSLLETGVREDLDEILQYAEEEAGFLMQLEVLTIPITATVAEAIELTRRAVADHSVDNYYKIYLIDKNQALVGECKLIKMFLANPDTCIEHLKQPVTLTVNPRMKREEIALLVMEHGEASVPVVDNQGRVLGRLTMDDLGEVVAEELEERIGHMAGTGEEDAVATKTFAALRQRLPWLLISLTGGIGTAYLMGFFEGELIEHPLLMFFVPLIAGMGGSVGVQTSSIMVRGMATGDILSEDVLLRLRRELSLALMASVVCAILICIFISLVLEQRKTGMLVAIAMIINMVVAAMLGTLIPLALKSLNIEPALSTGPFLTVGNDILGITIYMLLVKHLLPLLF